MSIIFLKLLKKIFGFPPNLLGLEIRVYPDNILPMILYTEPYGFSVTTRLLTYRLTNKGISELDFLPFNTNLYISKIWMERLESNQYYKCQKLVSYL